MLGWLVNERAIEPHIPMYDKSTRADGTFSREDFAYDQQRDTHICPKELTSTGTLVNDGTTRRDKIIHNGTHIHWYHQWKAILLPPR
jgi:hypothetical protein